MSKTLTNMERSAALIMSLDEDSAAEVFKFLSAQEIQQLSATMTNMPQVTQEQMAKTLEEFHADSEQFSAVNLLSTDHIRSVLVKALGQERASSLLEDIYESSGQNNGIETLNLMEPPLVAEMIRDEHPQIIATIMVHLERHQASQILEHFSDTLRNDVLLRIATFSGVQPAALQELTEVLSNMLSGQNLKRSKMGGIRTAAEILNLMPGQQEEQVLEAVRNHDESLAQQIIDEMFVFENLVGLEDRSIQLLLKEIDNETLVTALKGSPEAIIQKFLQNMSQRAAEMLRDDMEARGPVRVSQVEAEQKSILQTVRRLADSGEIVINSGGEDYV
ncbi:MAG: flagellar motor switch protein FliG [Cobetia sp.]|uniref:flagellar motor switch protein FliG n=1 Tax=Cobetia TaxID=204286 RepID=UPI000C5FEA11|nr:MULTISPECIES: flagellar motor switch protein FliG [Cobetia]MBR9754522.1 flagellar motor switch protein FliG [Gammaproteobacteria bacterium]UTV88260.1 flagellar motor switch protein FliG [Cobetia litoralis]MBE2169131.1 flagellar motor switch protein FliG [Cobetia sp. 2AS1]MBK09265.1 flagellar motor switch protein FliG [Cobetia sp.]MBR9798086.1 flagellar motor switch protein FliG [Gammaproteobacteria bacterium]